MKILKNLSIFLTVLILASCQSEAGIETENLSESMTNELKLTLAAEQVTYDENLPKESKLLYGTKVEMIALGDGNYALGDMLFTDEDFAQSNINAKGQGVWDRRGGKWPNSTLLYKYSASMPQATKNKVDNAAQYITNNTDLTVRKWVSTDTAGYVWVNYSNDSGCSAQIGYRNKKSPGQSMNIASNCSEGSTIHEFLHAAGIVHEQNHWNRDAYLTVLYNNIDDNKEFNYVKLSDANGWEISDVVDVNSIMMYGSYFWQTATAKANGWRTMKKKDGGTIVPNRSYMTTNDKAIINAVY
ncbi:M12 family metallopeptidase [Polaribacter butkevichii]|uniref:Peptidase M12A domain-containing protein n=1 Tax=Polaribacter butkevichii TaxID=218490 RepID=A0A2P6CE20_9FLAO|nr:M12 family metallopeptidase [Polaribacter butkevichii]PQJ73108.1 hypothetical protein BTO14_07480 [Polaribacter butkevichii]